MTAGRLVLVDHCSAIAGGQVVLLELLDVLLDQGRRNEVIVACPDGPLAKAVEERDVALVIMDDAWRRLPELCRGNDVGCVIVNGLRWLPVIALSRTMRRKGRSELQLVYIDHSKPGTTVRRIIAWVCRQLVDAIVPVAAAQRRTRKTIDMPPLGLTETGVEELSKEPIVARSGTIRAYGRLDPVKGLDLLAAAA